MVRKVTISLPDELLESIDREAEGAGVSRSEIVQEASAHYLAHTSDERLTEQRRRDVEAAVTGMRTFEERYPVLDPRSSLEILREIREFDGGGPAWGTPERKAWERDVGYDEWRRGLEDDDAGI